MVRLVRPVMKIMSVMPGVHRFFNRILNQRLVDDGQHFLGAGLGGRQKTRAHTRDRKYGFSYFLHVSSLLVLGCKNSMSVPGGFIRPSNASKPASSRMVTPNSRAFSSLLPASAPATT